MQDFDKWILASSAIVVALGTIIATFKPFMRWATRVYKDMVFLFRQREAHDNIERALAEILVELRPNGGGSLADSVHRTERKVDFLGARHLADLNGAKVAMVETDTTGGIIWVNRAYVRMLGRGLNDVKGQGWINVIAPEQRNQITAMWNSAVRSKRSIDEDVCFIDVGGHVFVAHVVSTPIISDDGVFHGHLTEITPYDDEHLGTCRCGG